MNTEILKYLAVATVAVAGAYTGYRWYNGKDDKTSDAPVDKEQTTNPVYTETVEDSTQKEDIIIIGPEQNDDVINIIEESETIDMIESEETADDLVVNEPTALEDVILCFTKLLLLEDEGVEIQDKLNQYCDLIIALRRAKGLNNKAFKAIVKRVGIQPNSSEWNRLFSELKHYEAAATE